MSKVDIGDYTDFIYRRKSGAPRDESHSPYLMRRG